MSNLGGGKHGIANAGFQNTLAGSEVALKENIEKSI